MKDAKKTTEAKPQAKPAKCDAAKVGHHACKCADCRDARNHGRWSR